MKIQCPGCQVTFTVPDEKIPDVKGVRILCPKCKRPIDLDHRIHGSMPGARAEAPASGPEGDAVFFYEDATTFDVVEEGARTSLLCVATPARSDTIRQVLDELRFFVVQAPRAEFALKKLNHNRYDLIVLEEGFDNARQSENLVLHHLELLPMHLRRQFFLMLVSDSLPTFDGMLAFRMGVNMIMNAKDLDKMKVLLTRAMKDHRAAYGLFFDELAKRGQR